MKKSVIGFLLRLLTKHAGTRLALWSQGTVGYFGLAKETTWGTAVARTDYGEILSESLATTIDRFGTRNAFAGFYEPDDYAGARRSAGGIVMAAFPGMMGHFLKAAFQNNSVAVVASGFLWRNIFTNPTSEFADGVPRQPYTLEVFRDVVSSHIFAGAVMSRLQMALAPNQDLRLTAEWIAKTATLAARGTPTFPSSPSDPFTWETASVSVGGSAMTRIEAFNLSIDNALEGILSMNASNEISRIRATNPQMIRVSGTLDFGDVAEYHDFINQTERAMKFNITRGQSFALLIDMPRFVYTSHAGNIAGRGRLTASFEGMARYLVSSATAIAIHLTTTKSNY